MNKRNEKTECHTKPFRFCKTLGLVGVKGFEPPTSCSQSRRATNCATPRYDTILNERLFLSAFVLRLLCSPSRKIVVLLAAPRGFVILLFASPFRAPCFRPRRRSLSKPKAGALPTALHPDMILYETKGCFICLCPAAALLALSQNSRLARRFPRLRNTPFCFAFVSSLFPPPAAVCQRSTVPYYNTRTGACQSCNSCRSKAKSACGVFSGSESFSSGSRIFSKEWASESDKSRIVRKIGCRRESGSRCVFS